MHFPPETSVRAMVDVDQGDPVGSEDDADDMNSPPDPGVEPRGPRDRQTRRPRRRPRTVSIVSTDFDANDQMAWIEEVSAEAPALQMSNQERDQKQFLARALSGLGLFRHDCDCNNCAPSLYNNWPLVCPRLYQPTDLTVRKGGRPCSVRSRVEVQNKFEALHLVDEAIKSFDRPTTDMSDDQQAALNEFKSLNANKDLETRLSGKDCSADATESYMSKVTSLLNRIFFFGAISPITFVWKLDKKDMEARLFGLCKPKKDLNGRYRHEIFLHPISMPIELHADAPRLRLGVLLHEMIHAFLSEYACIACATTQQNISDDFSNGHGRAWHRLAASIEKAATELLECGELDLGRLMALNRYYAPTYTAGIRDPLDRIETETAYNPSFHDLQEFGFLNGELIGMR